jgi:hypothetical protein
LIALEGTPGAIEEEQKKMNGRKRNMTWESDGPEALIQRFILFIRFANVDVPDVALNPMFP